MKQRRLLVLAVLCVAVVLITFFARTSWSTNARALAAQLAGEHGAARAADAIDAVYETARRFVNRPGKVGGS